jgi:dTDP-4-amino-4,6-dideoxygalactose transaminase
VRSPRRDALQEHLRATGIETLVHYPVSLNHQPAFTQASAGDCPAAERAAREVLSLPLHPRLADADVARVAEAAATFQKGHVLA